MNEMKVSWKSNREREREKERAEVRVFLFRIEVWRQWRRKNKKF